jgi:hypothetical protein
MQADFEMTRNAMGFYTLEPMTPAAIERAGAESVYFDRTDFAAECAAGLLSEGYKVTLDGQELILAE